MEQMKKNKIVDFIKSDLWIVLLDIVAVNAAYFLALVARLSVGFNFREELFYYVEYFSTFAPFYTAICLVVFLAFRLYGGIWRYAGINDMNRIALANAVTSIVQIVGTLVFVGRMPITYYVLGALFQFLMIAAIRFAYRIFIIERRKLSVKQADALIVGRGEECHYLLRLLNSGLIYRPVGVVDRNTDVRSMDGLPVYQSLQNALESHEVDCVFIADSKMSMDEKKPIHEICKEKDITLRDYTSFFTYSEDSDSYYGAQEFIPSPKSDSSMIPFSPPDIGDSEINEVSMALRSGWITTGPRTKLLERRLAAYIDTGDAKLDTELNPDRWKNRVACLNSATASEELNLRILGIRAGDEVIVPAYTYTASASAAIHCGATIKFVDIQKDGDPTTHMPEMDYEQLESSITPKTKAIITVDLGGIVCDYDKIYEIVNRKKELFIPMESDGTPLGELSSRIQKSIGRVAVVADCAHSLGGSRVVFGEKAYCGAIADFTSFSFHAVKNFTTAEGGASTWKPIYGVDNKEIYKFFQLLSLHGQSKDALAKTKAGAWEYDVIGPWYKCNMTDIMAAIGLRQLDRYPQLLERRKQIIQKYDTTCDELGISHLIHHTEGMDSSNHLYLIRIPGFTIQKRNMFIEKMSELGVSVNVHYKPLPMMTAYKAFGWDIKDFPNTYSYYENLVSLPLHTLLTDEDVDRVCRSMKEVIQKECFV